MIKPAASLAGNDGAPGRPQPSPRRPLIALLQTQAEGAGAQEIMRILGAGLSARGYEVHNIFLFRRTAAFDAQPNTHFCAIERPGSVIAVFRMLRDLVRHLRTLKPDVVLTFQHYGNLIGTAAARMTGGAVFANRTSARALEPAWTRVLDFWFGLIGLFDHVVVNSKAVREEYRSYPSTYRKRIVHIDHGFEPKRSEASREEARRRFGLPLDVSLLGSVARLHPEKNLGAAIQLLAERPGWHLAIAGQGEQRAGLDAMAQDLQVAERVHFVGELSPKQIALFLKSLDVFVFPSRMETFGLAAVEAAQAGIPVVASDIEVMREVLMVDDVPCALFVDPDDTSSFVDEVDRLLHDHELRSALIGRADTLAQRYSLEAMVDRYAELIRAMRTGAGVLPVSA
jgi:glycosyltransferase involved in cell wall biosynthesis